MRGLSRHQAQLRPVEVLLLHHRLPQVGEEGQVGTGAHW
jgi:hypothetical protein